MNLCSTTKPKVGREYQHLEDLTFIYGSRGVLDALNIIDEIVQQPNNLTVKWDGSITIYWGRDSEQNFVLVGKNGWGKFKATCENQLYDFILKSGKGEIWREKFAESMKKIFRIVKKSTPLDFDRYVYGDILYHPGQSFYITDNLIKFTPNLVTYSVDLNSSLGQQIKQSKIALVVHSKFKEFGSNCPEDNFDIEKLNSKDVIVLSKTYLDASLVVDQEKLTHIEKTSKHYAALIDDFLLPEPGLSDIKNIIYRYVNYMNRARSLENLETEFFDWLEKSNISSQKKQKIKIKNEKNPQALFVIFNLVKQIIKVKDSIIQQLDNSSLNVSASTKDQIGGEGYIFDKSKIKLVPRNRWQPR